MKIPTSVWLHQFYIVQMGRQQDGHVCPKIRSWKAQYLKSVEPVSVSSVEIDAERLEIVINTMTIAMDT
jgi:hypothetical protein